MQFTVSTKFIVRMAITTALYIALMLTFAPVSFEALQFRVASVLLALAVCGPEFAFGIALGNFFANMVSPFGFYDFAIMPIFNIIGGLSAYALRRWLGAAIAAQSAIIALGVAVFPLGLGGGMSVWVTFPYVFISTAVIIAGGSVILLPAYRAVAERIR